MQPKKERIAETPLRKHLRETQALPSASQKASNFISTHHQKTSSQLQTLHTTSKSTISRLKSAIVDSIDSAIVKLRKLFTKSKQKSKPFFEKTKAKLEEARLRIKEASSIEGFRRSVNKLKATVRHTINKVRS